MCRFCFYIVVGMTAIVIGLVLLPPPGPSSAATSGTITYSYDSVGRVVQDANNSGNSGTYSYDPAGNRLTSSIN